MQDVLEVLAETIGCEYISDLPHIFRDRLSRKIVEELDENRFSLENWNDALSYLTDERFDFTDKKAAKDQLLIFLK